MCSVSPVVSLNCTVSCSTKRNCCLAASMDSGLASLPVTELSEGISNTTDNTRYLNHETNGSNKLERYGIRETASERVRIYPKNIKQFLSRHTRTLCVVFPKGRSLVQNYSSYTSLISKTFLLFANDTIIPGGG